MTNYLKRQIFYTRDKWLPYIRNYAVGAGVLPGHKDYIRYIILGRARTGSNFLRGLLNSHSQIVSFGELFQNPPYIGWELQGYSQSKQLLELFNNRPVEFLRENVFSRFPLSTRAVGFKIFYYHAQNDQYKPVWDYLINDNKIRVVHIKRRNMLKTHLSLKLAFLSDKWANVRGENISYPPIPLDYEECLNDFIQTREWEIKYDNLFNEHATYNIYYEDLSKDYINEMKQIQSFLEVEIENVQPETKKQLRVPLSRSIINYQALKEKFTGSPWEVFFED